MRLIRDEFGFKLAFFKPISIFRLNFFELPSPPAYLKFVSSFDKSWSSKSLGEYFAFELSLSDNELAGVLEEDAMYDIFTLASYFPADSIFI